MTMPATMSDDERPDSPNAAVRMQADAVVLCRDVYEGTSAMRDPKKVNDYLPSYPAELPLNYDARVKRSVFFNAFERSVQGLVGMVCRRDPVLDEDVPAAIQEHWENIDLAGTHGAVFARQRALDALVDGHCGILVDFPPLAANTAAIGGRRVEQELGARPYWVGIGKHQIVSFLVEQVEGRQVLSQLVLHFCYQRPRGSFGEEEVNEYRVYRRGVRPPGQPQAPVAPTFAVYRGVGDESPTPVPELQGAIANQTEIPFVAIYGGRMHAPLCSKPPLLDLAYRNLMYFQVESDQTASMHWAGSPVPVLAGDTNDGTDPTKTGPSWLMRLTHGSTFSLVETSGAALGAFRQKLEDLKAEMAVLGLAMIQRETRAAETEGSKRMDKMASDSVLAAFARGLQDGLEQAVAYHANYLKLKGGSVEVNTDFESQTMDSAAIQTLSNLVAAGQLSLETMWQMLEGGEVLPDDFDAEAERERIATDPMTRPPEPQPVPEPGAMAEA